VSTIPSEDRTPAERAEGAAWRELSPKAREAAREFLALEESEKGATRGPASAELSGFGRSGAHFVRRSGRRRVAGLRTLRADDRLLLTYPYPVPAAQRGCPCRALQVTSPGDDRAGHCSEGHDHDHRDGEVEHDRHDRYEDAEQDRHEVGGDGESELLAGFL
jgi:hypothetical protein